MSLSYAQAPRPLGGPVSFTLDGDRLTVDSGRKVQEVRLGAVEQVRMTYEPRSFSRKAFRTRLRVKDGKSITFSSLHWKSLVEAESLDVEYRTFTRALLAAVAAANPGARFVAGRPLGMWIAATLLGAASVLAMALFVHRALSAGHTSAAALGAFFFLAALWQVAPFIRLNRPRGFRPDAPPSALMP